VRERVAGPLAEAFAHTFTWAVVISAIALIPAVALVIANRLERAEDDAVAHEPAARLAA
jgi:hypothetical protein